MLISKTIRRGVAALFLFVAAASCSGTPAKPVTPAEVLATIDAVLNGACNTLTMIPNEIQVCSGIAGAEGLAGVIAGYFGSASVTPKLAAAVTAHHAAHVAGAPVKLLKVRGLPAFAPQPIADVLNEQTENTVLVGYVMSQIATPSIVVDGGSP